MDGTLLLTKQSPDQSWQQVCYQFASPYDLSPDLLLQALRESYVAYKSAIKDDAEKQRRDRLDPFAVRQEMVERALAQVGRKDSLLASAMVHAYESLREAHRQLAPHALEVLQTLRTAGVRLALLTNGNATYQRRKIQQHHLASLFDCILIEEEFGTAKPNPHIYLYALSQLHLSARETWMVGDDLGMDVAAPQQLGMIAIWFDPARRGLPKGSTVHPNAIIHTLPELLDLDEKGILSF